MSEERFDRIENQLSQVLQALTSVDSRLNALEQNQNSLKQNVNAAREDIGELRNRINSVEGTVRVAITDGFRSHDAYLDDLNLDLAQNERLTRRLNRRVERLERLE
jgi:chromosome segregation ATPase